ncbi:MAG TPA: DUF4097 family beta strand repeat-containing protein [Symbiobacteriaceae bacterium]|nr:DUF4097 family beta strand repeat-containing protein [Symbiobacteriaceae bacterium]
MKTWSQTYPLAEGAGVHVHQHAGPVQVVGSQTPEVTVTASCKEEIDFGEFLEIQQTGQGLVVEVKARRWSWSGTPAIRLDVTVPEGTSCSVESGSGAVEVVGTGAPVRIETGSGDVNIATVGHADIETGSGAVKGSQINGSVSAETGSGSVDFTAVNGALSLEVGSGAVAARQINGDLRVDTGSGSVVVEDVGGRIELETGSGKVSVRRVHGASLTVDSGGGSVHLREIDVAQLSVDGSSGGVEAELAQVYPGGTYEITTGSGGVSVALPPTADLTVRAESPSGRVSTTGLNLRVIHEEAGEFEAVIGQGRARLTVEAGSGGVRLMALAGGSGAAPAPASDPTLSEAGARVVESVKDDPALESSEQLRRIVEMVEAGKLTPQEALDLLRALDEEEPA